MPRCIYSSSEYTGDHFGSRWDSERLVAHRPKAQHCCCSEFFLLKVTYLSGTSQTHIFRWLLSWSLSGFMGFHPGESRLPINVCGLPWHISNLYVTELNCFLPHLTGCLSLKLFLYLGLWLQRYQKRRVHKSLLELSKICKIPSWKTMLFSRLLC